ncbi:extracellular triacylglycerol lipase precursor [Roridomyces roridus]|uniref:Carboxylic ester hydrolase n=1 Tax=Roridomyces roridus TaxID=1738132 RepID=A0AAD7FUD4_9AGAR|nr:extracellular triacylglycerol lipase precursor [Roridomyces roridus]
MPLLLLLKLASVVTQLWWTGHSDFPAVQLRDATVVGLDIPTFRQDLFAGIPFAEPPLGNLRLKPPVLKPALDSGTFHASSFKLACLQLGLPVNQISEDCLGINVLRPAGTRAGANLPVMFWTYGGAFQGGLSTIYNGNAIVQQSVLRGTPVIYVSFNYRLGPLGFPQGQEAADNGALNLGLKDQLAALEWVQLNIGAFGGDKSKVTVFGQSAGAIMISLLFLNSPISSLARAAILESGSHASTPLLPPQYRQGVWQNFVKGVPSCASLATSGSTFDCLQKANTTEIFQGLAMAASHPTGILPWNPVIDGPGGIIPDLPSVLLQNGQFAKLPFISGTNLDEGTLFAEPTVSSTEGIALKLIARASPTASPEALNSSVAAILELYPDIPSIGSPFNTGNETFGRSSQYKREAAILGDQSFLSQRRFWMQTAANASIHTYGYLFTQSHPKFSPALGVSHGLELSYLFGKLDGTASATFLSLVMMDYWISFATSLTPNDGFGFPRPRWTQWTSHDQTVMQLDGANLTMIPDNFRAKQANFFNLNPALWQH